MTDADLIYNACLRVEERLDARVAELRRANSTTAALHVMALGNLMQLLREEIGNGLSEEGR